MTTTDPVASYPLILLAAGASTRMGMPKGLVPIAERTFLDYQLQRFAEAGGADVVVVLGAHCSAYLEALPWIREALRQPVTHAAGERVFAVENKEWEKGPFSSLCTGIDALFAVHHSPVFGAFVCPIDTPFPSPLVWSELARSFSSRYTVVKPEYQGKGGHPVLLGVSFLKQMLTVNEEESRLDVQMRKLPRDQICRVAVDDCFILENLNDPAAFATWRTSRSRDQEKERGS